MRIAFTVNGREYTTYEYDQIQMFQDDDGTWGFYTQSECDCEMECDDCSANECVCFNDCECEDGFGGDGCECGDECTCLVSYDCDDPEGNHGDNASASSVSSSHLGWIDKWDLEGFRVIKTPSGQPVQINTLLGR